MVGNHVGCTTVVELFTVELVTYFELIIFIQKVHTK